MTLTIELTPEQESRLKAEAERSGLPLPQYALQRLVGISYTPTDEDERLAAIDAAYGALADAGISSEDFLREKHETRNQ